MKSILSTQRRSWITRMGFMGVLLRLAPVLATFNVMAKKSDAMEAIRLIVGANTVYDGRINVVIPPLVENGNLVVLKVAVESPMNDSDYVKAIHIIAEGNPLPNIFSAYLTPRSGRANITTRVRLAESQRVWAIAEMSDGSFWRSYANTLVTLSACTEGL